MEVTDELLDRMERIQLEYIADGASATYLSNEGFSDIASCESPIELLFGWAFFCNPSNTGGVSVYVPSTRQERSIDAADQFLDRFCADSGCTMLFGPAPKVVLTPQAIIGPYRTDFLMVFRDHYGHKDYDGEKSLFVVECDGHDFHERTKQQAARDKKRDRWLTTAGMPVLRFTGSEIWADPIACAAQAWELVHREIRVGERRRG